MLSFAKSINKIFIHTYCHSDFVKLVVHITTINNSKCQNVQLTNSISVHKRTSAHTIYFRVRLHVSTRG